jgi:hypothetical protein
MNTIDYCEAVLRDWSDQVCVPFLQMSLLDIHTHVMLSDMQVLYLELWQHQQQQHLSSTFTAVAASKPSAGTPSGHFLISPAAATLGGTPSSSSTSAGAALLLSPSETASAGAAAAIPASSSFASSLSLSSLIPAAAGTVTSSLAALGLGGSSAAALTAERKDSEGWLAGGGLFGPLVDDMQTLRIAMLQVGLVARSASLSTLFSVQMFVDFLAAGFNRQTVEYRRSGLVLSSSSSSFGEVSPGIAVLQQRPLSSVCCALFRTAFRHCR